MKKAPVHFVLCLALGGCTGIKTTTHHWVVEDESNLARMNQELSGKKLSVFAEDGNSYEAHNLNVAPDSTHWLTNELRRVAWPTRKIRIIQLRQESQKQWGVLGGALVGFLASVASAESGTCEAGRTVLCTTRAENVAYAAAASVPLFAVLGFLVTPGARVTTYVKVPGVVRTGN